MTPRRHPRRPKIDPRRLQDDLQELLFSTSFLSSILVRLGSDFGLILAPLEAPKWRASAGLVGFFMTLKAHDGPRWPQDRPRRPQDPPRCPKSRPRAPQRPPRPPQNDQKSTQDPPKTTENRFILRLLLSSSSPFFFSLLVLLSSLFSLRSSLCFPFSSLFASLLFLFSSLLFSSSSLGGSLTTEGLPFPHRRPWRKMTVLPQNHLNFTSTSPQLHYSKSSQHNSFFDPPRPSF